MDYEWHIRRLEKELDHLRAMKDLQSEHLDAHDKSLDAAIGRFERIEATLERVAVGLEVLTAHTNTIAAKVDILTDKFNGLIEALTREHGNGQHRT